MAKKTAGNASDSSPKPVKGGAAAKKKKAAKTAIARSKGKAAAKKAPAANSKSAASTPRSYSTSSKKTAKPASGAKATTSPRDVSAESTDGVKGNPWTLRTPSGQSEYLAYQDAASNPPALVVMVGKTELRYDLRCIADLCAMLKKHGDWILLGSADEQKPAKEGTVEAWARSPDNPLGGWYGLKKGLRGRFANYVPPVLQKLGIAEVENKPKDNRMRAL